MPSRRIELVMPAPSKEAFEAFHNHKVRLEWDTLLAVAFVEGGGAHPYPGAITTNWGRGWKRLLGMRTRFLTYDPPQLAAAVLVEPTGIFAHWAASMRHRDRPDGSSDLVYTFTIKLRPNWLSWLLDPIAARLFERETRLRFAAMAAFLRDRRGM
jgi:hypothetical protein